MSSIVSRLILVFAMTAAAQNAIRAGESLVYFGTYTGPNSKGIYVSRMNLEEGTLTPPRLAAEAQNPSFLAVSPSGQHLYAVGELNEVAGRPGGIVTAFRIEPDTGALSRLNEQSARGAAPCHLTVDASGKWVLVANYSGGNLAVLPIREDGSLGEVVSFIQHEGSGVNPRRQRQAHAHSINLDAANRFAVAADLGLDKLMVYRFDPNSGALKPHDPPFTTLPPGSGPRHFAFHPAGRHAFVINELLSTLAVLRFDPAAGTLEPVHSVSTLPDGFDGDNSTAEVQVHPSGRFVYGSNRGHDSIAVFAFDPGTQRLRLVEHEPTQGRTPRNFCIDPSGRWLLAANQGSGTVVVFRIDPETGALTPTGRKVELGAPVCVRFVLDKSA